jgi:tetratricopeptide (TPR) repeat protein
MRTISAICVSLLLSVAALATTPGVQSAAEMLNAGRADDAIRLLDSHLKAQPYDAEAYNLLARTYFASHRWNDAMTAGEKAVALAPDNSSYHMWLARIYGEKANHSNFITAARLVKKIRNEFERAVQLDSSNLAARTDLAEFYISAPEFLGGGKTKALREAEFISHQDKAVAHWVQARIYDKEGLDGEAESEYQLAVQASDGDARYWLELASFYGNRRRYPEMETAIEKAVAEQRRGPVRFFDAGSLLLSTGRDFKGAAQLIHRYLAGRTSEEAPAFQAHYVLGQIHEREGDKAAAAQEYRAALALARDYHDAQVALSRLEK